MSLDFDLGPIMNDSERKHLARDKQGNLTGLAQTLIFASMFVDIGVITEDNIDEFYRRCWLYEHGLSALRSKGDDPVYITRDEVASFVGLRTNVATRTSKQFDASLKTKMFERLDQRWHAHLRAAEKHT